RWSVLASRTLAKIVVGAFLPHASRMRCELQQPLPPRAGTVAQRPSTPSIDRTFLQAWHKWRCGASRAITMALVLACLAILGCRHRHRRSVTGPMVCNTQSRHRRLTAPPAIIDSGRRILRQTELDLVSPLVEPVAGEALDRCAICLEAMPSGFRDKNARGTAGSNSLRKLPCLHIFHALCLDPWLTTCCAQCPMCKYDIAATHTS
ncbi:hypothetical protein GGH95_003371, partial [Coemansia sp. RSA 1836]